MQTVELDAYSHVNNAVRLYKSGKVVNSYSTVWLPFVDSALTLPLYLHFNPHIIPRITILLFSLGSIIIIYHYTRALTNKNDAALTAAIIFSLLPIRIFTSTITLSEPIFTFFLLLSLFYFIKPKPQYIPGLISLNIAHGMRYESWFLLPLFWLIFLFSKKLNSLFKILSIILSCLIPIGWLIHLYVKHGNALLFFQIKYNLAQSKPNPAFNNWLLSFQEWFDQLISVLPPILIGFFLISLYQYIKSRHSLSKKTLSLLPLYLFLILIIQVYLGTMEWFPQRYLYTTITLSIPILSYGLMLFYDFIFKKTGKKTAALISLISIVIITLSLSLGVKHSADRHFTPIKPDVIKIIDYLKYKKINAFDYYQHPSQPTHNNTAIQYFTQTSISLYPRNILTENSSLNSSNYSIIETRSRSEFTLNPLLPKPVYTNSSFIILPPSNQ